MLSFHLENSIFVNRALKDFPRFFSDPRSLAAWDPSVAHVEPTCDGPLRSGYTFDTIGPARNGKPGKRSSYRVITLEPELNQVELVASPVFRRAIWTFRYSSRPGGTLVVCGVEATVKALYFPLAVLLRFNRNALLGDLRRLKDAVEKHPASESPAQ